ncbi:Protein of unknown function DUF3431 [Aspergillus oryzae]|uniref:Uncharacterized protein n=1 Tax=Aspergillus oryzae TaxID=5062 RepID=A0A1S9DH10_ASPOZ|nr:Protein of unknown function DUF3431 [Aspergillus oryzae]
MPEQLSWPSRMAYFYRTRTSTIHKALFPSFIIFVLFSLYHVEFFQPRPSPDISAMNPTPTPAEANDGKESPLLRGSNDVALVAPKTRFENVRWIGCTTYIYTTDENPEKGYIHPRTVKGHEAAAYLTYIVNHYDRLSPFTIFLRGKDEHWHNDAAGPKSSNVLLNLRFEAVRAYGFLANPQFLNSLGINVAANSSSPGIESNRDHGQNMNNFYTGPPIPRELMATE